MPTPRRRTPPTSAPTPRIPWMDPTRPMLAEPIWQATPLGRRGAARRGAGGGWCATPVLGGGSGRLPRPRGGGVAGGGVQRGEKPQGRGREARHRRARGVRGGEKGVVLLTQ